MFEATGQVAYATLRGQIRTLVFFENFIGASIVLSKIQPHHAEAFIAHRIRIGRRTTTVNKDIRALKCTFNLTIELRGYLAGSQNPFGKIKQRKKAKRTKRYVSVKESVVV